LSIHGTVEETTINRPEIASKPTPERIKKTVIFFDSKSDIRSCTDALRNWLEKKKGYTADEAETVVREYHATLSEEANKWLRV